MVIVYMDDVGKLMFKHRVSNLAGLNGVGHVGDSSNKHLLLFINGGEVQGEFAMDVMEAVYHLSYFFEYNMLCICT